MKKITLIISLISILSFECKKKEEKSVPVEVISQKGFEKKKEGIIAKVNGVPIDAKILFDELDSYTRGGKRQVSDSMLERFKSHILNRVIEEELLKQEVKKQGVVVTEEEIKSSFEDYKQRFKSDAHFEEYLKHSKTTIEKIKEKLQDKLSLEKYLEGKHLLDVGEDEVKKFYEDTKEENWTTKEMVHAQHILIRLPEKPTKEDEEKAQKKINEIKKLLRKEDFSLLAKKYSEDPGSKDQGGDLGSFPRGMMVKEFEDTAFSLNEGEFTKEPVKTRFGYHFIKVIEKKPKTIRPFEEVKETIKKSLKAKKFYKARSELVERLKESALIEKFL